LGWHFANWHHMGYCDLTNEGLRELDAAEAATIFDQAFELVVAYWDHISDLLTAGVNEFGKWYHGSPLSEALGPLNQRMWQIAEESTEFRLMRFWLQYARKYPERVATEKG